MKVLVLGLNPSKQLGKSATLKRLREWLEVLELQYVSFDNIYPGFNQFSLKDINADYIREISQASEKVLALGRRVSDILGLMGIDHFCLPHPSGLNRQLNNSKVIESKLMECKSYLREA